jgi:N utilization substance protein A
MIDLKVLNSVIDQMQEEKGIPKEKMIEAIEMALATAYKKEYGKRGQVIKAKFDTSSGKMEFIQIKTVVDKDKVVMREDKKAETEADERFKRSRKLEEEKEELDEKGEKIVYYNPEHHIFLEDAKKIKKDAKLEMN